MLKIMFSAKDAHRIATENKKSTESVDKALGEIRTAAIQGNYFTTIYHLNHDDVKQLETLGYRTMYFHDHTYKKAGYPCHVYWD